METIIFDTYEQERATQWLRHDLHPPYARIAERMGISRDLFSKKLGGKPVNAGKGEIWTFTAAELAQLNTLRAELHSVTA